MVRLMRDAAGRHEQETKITAGLTTTVTAFLCPTKSMLVFQPSLSMIWAVGPELFMAWVETRYCPSGDQLRRRT